MTNTKRFGITEDGIVFALNGRFRRLGHISHLEAARTPIALEVRRWWSKQLDSDAPLNLIEIVEKDKGQRQYQVRIPETELIPGTDSVERMKSLAA